MWFDPANALAEIEARESPPPAHVPRPPAADLATPLDPEGLPFTACRACGGGDWWKPAAQPFEGPGWACAACTPPGDGLLRHACAVPVQAAQRGTDKADPMGYHDTVQGARR